MIVYRSVGWRGTPFNTPYACSTAACNRPSRWLVTPWKRAIVVALSCPLPLVCLGLQQPSNAKQRHARMLGFSPRVVATLATTSWCGLRSTRGKGAGTRALSTETVLDYCATTWRYVAHQSLAAPAAVESRLSQRHIRHRLLAAASARSGGASGILVLLPRNRAEPVVWVFRSVACRLQVYMVVMDRHWEPINVERWQVQRVVVLPAETCLKSTFPVFVPQLV